MIDESIRETAEIRGADLVCFIYLHAVLSRSFSMPSLKCWMIWSNVVAIWPKIVVMPQTERDSRCGSLTFFRAIYHKTRPLLGTTTLNWTLHTETISSGGAAEKRVEMGEVSMRRNKLVVHGVRKAAFGQISSGSARLSEWVRVLEVEDCLAHSHHKQDKKSSTICHCWNSY